MPDKAQLASKLKEISSFTEKHFEEEQNIGVLDGLSGIALFHFYYGKFLDDDTQAETGLAILEKALTLLNDGYNVPTYCSGIAGFGWTVQHLESVGFLEIDSEELLEPFDDFLFNQLKLNFEDGYYDFLHGALGYGFYFLQRYKHSSNESLKERYSQMLSVCLSELERLSITEGEHIKWRSILDIQKGNTGFNLSLSHGMSSILNFLNRLYEYDEFKASVKPMIQGVTSYIQSFYSNKPEQLSLFPCIIEDEIPITYNTRVAWCYGDLGIGIALNSAEDVLNVPHSQKLATKVFAHIANRRSTESSMVVDAGICHGSYGNAQFFQTLNTTNKDLHLDNTIEHWIQDGLQKAIYPDGYAGYKQWNGESQGWEPHLSLLEGVAGIGLVLVDYLSETPNTWDECLMLH